MVFNVLVSNADDHLRNHGFLRAGSSGWRLSPAYDLNPAPEKAGLHAIAFSEHERTSSLPVVLSVAPQFGLTASQARDIAMAVAAVTAKWRDAAKRSGINKPEIDRMASAFEHEHLAAALRLGTVSPTPAVRSNQRKSKKTKRARARA
jgi:serine/threonine-protein kinase HipA